MSWFNYKPSTSEADTREDRRKKLEEERLKRAQDRVKRQQKLQAELEAQRLSEEAISELLTLDPSEVFAERFTEEEVAELLDTSEEVEIKMTNFEDENEADGKSALDKLGSVKCEFSKEDIEFWFSELEGQMEAIEVKSHQKVSTPQISTCRNKTRSEVSAGLAESRRRGRHIQTNKK